MTSLLLKGLALLVFCAALAPVRTQAADDYVMGGPAACVP